MRSRPSIKFRQLQYFLAVAETLHFSKAAESLFVTQPTLSHQLAELEEQLGAQLFDRAGKSIQLTPAGKVFREHARRSIEAIESGCVALDELAGLQRGELRIGVTQSFVRRLMPPIISEFRRRHPAIQLYVNDLTATQIERELSEGQLDIGIAFAPALMQETEIEPILKDRLLLVAPRDHALASRKEVRLAELSGLPMAMLGRTYFTRQLIEDYFKEAGAELVVACETNTVDLIIGLTMTSDLLSILPESGIQKSKEIAILRIVDPVPERVSALLWSRSRYRSLAALTFAQIVRDRFSTRLPAI